jgi:hypothetical protein
MSLKRSRQSSYEFSDVLKTLSATTSNTFNEKNSFKRVSEAIVWRCKEKQTNHFKIGFQHGIFYPIQFLKNDPLCS